MRSTHTAARDCAEQAGYGGRSDGNVSGGGGVLVMPNQRRSNTTGYFIAIGATLAAFLLRLLLAPVLGVEVPFITLFPAVVFAGWYGGLGPAIVAAVIGGVGAWFLFIPPQFSFALERTADIVGLIVYFIVTLAIAGLSGAMHDAQRRAQSAERRALRQRETMRVTFSSIGDAVITTDNEGMVTFLNPVAEALCGWSWAEARGQPLSRVFTIINEDTRAPVPNPVDTVLSRGQTVGLANHTVLVSRDGSEHPIDDSAAPIREGDGPIIGAVLVFRDISARRAAEKELRASERESRHLAAIVATSDDAIVSKDLNGVVMSWNRAAENVFGYSADEMIGQSITRVIPEERLDEEPDILGRIRRGERVDHFETVRMRKDGRRFPVSLTISPIVDAEGRIIGVSKIARDITQQKIAEETLREADQRKTEFIALLAHELRNPLASIRNGLQILAMTDGQQPTIVMMQRQLSQMVRLIDDLLDVSRISRGKIELRPQRIELAAVLRDAVAAAQPVCDRLGHVLAVAVPDEPIYLDADPSRLTQVVGNLLDNACKFTKQGGKINLSVTVENTTVVVRVIDNGIGIAPDQMPRIFEMFMQADTSLERTQSGLGLGLALAKTLIEMHAGTIEVRSAGLGHGTELTIRLPIASAPASQVAAPVVSASTATHRILVVDDNRDSADSLAMLLELNGHTVRAAYDGIDAVQSASEFQPNVILLDIGLPRLNGYDAARQIRALPHGTGVFLIALTGWGQDADRQRSEEAGFDAHLVKPLDYQALIRMLEQRRA